MLETNLPSDEFWNELGGSAALRALNFLILSSVLELSPESAGFLNPEFSITTVVFEFF